MKFHHQSLLKFFIVCLKPAQSSAVYLCGDTRITPCLYIEENNFMAKAHLWPPGGYLNIQRQKGMVQWLKSVVQWLESSVQWPKSIPIITEEDGPLAEDYGIFCLP